MSAEAIRGTRPSRGGFPSAPAGLRAWQLEALPIAEDPARRDILIDATPGAGKTTFALTVARRALDAGRVDRVVIVAPTDHLRTQWADAAGRFGLHLDPTLANSHLGIRHGTTGYVTTYAQVGSAPTRHAARVRAARTLVVLDEIHHAGDGQTWGEGTRVAFEAATRRLSLSGTPFRTGTEQIPFITYDSDADGGLLSRADYSYSYRQALADQVVRPVVFAAYTGTARWRNSAGDVLTGDLSEGPKRTELQVWKHLLDPNGQWVPHVIAAVDQRISDLRAAGVSNAGGLLLASDRTDARAYARIVQDITGRAPVVALSDDPASSDKIAAFRDSDDRIIVAVRQVSEGVDIARLAVCGWLCSYRTPLFFAQAVGRVVRSRGPHESATVFLPAVRPLLALAAELEDERNHCIAPPAPGGDLDLGDDLAEVASPPELGTADSAVELLSSEARFAHVLAAGEAVTAPTSSGPVPDADSEELGLFAGGDFLTPAQTATVLAARDHKHREQAGKGRRTPPALPVPTDPPTSAPATAMWRQTNNLRKQINGMVARIAARTGRTHPAIHIAARKAVPGPATSEAGHALLLRRRDWLTSHPQG